MPEPSSPQPNSLRSILAIPWKVSDKTFLIAVIAFILVITSIPYAYGYWSAPPDKKFMGMMLDVPDHLQYFAWMRDLAQSNLVSNRMTPEPNSPLFFNLLWWGLGRIGRLGGWHYDVVYQILRFASILLFLPLAYRMCSWFLKDPHQRRTAFLVICFTSGFGWVLVAMKYLTGGDLLFPLTVYVAEGNTFLSMLGYPHFIAALLYIFVFDLLLRGQARAQLRYAVAAGLFALFLGWQHAYDLVAVYAIIAAYALLLLLRDRKIPLFIVKSGLIIGVISWWPALYSVLLTSLDPIWEEILAQFANAGVYTPNLLLLPVLLGPAFLLAIYTVVKRRPFQLTRLDDNSLFILGWFLISFVLVYLPVDYQIHLINGWQIPIAVLATQGLFDYILPAVQRLASRGKNLPVSRSPLPFVENWLPALFLLLVVPTNLYLWGWRFYDLSRHDYPYYLRNSEIEALNWLDAHTRSEDVVLSSLAIGQYIPAHTGAHAYLAHWAQTLDFFGNTGKVTEFYSGKAPGERMEQILQEKSVDYVYYGPAERLLGDLSPQALPMKIAFSNQDVVIYQVDH